MGAKGLSEGLSLRRCLGLLSQKLLSAAWVGFFRDSLSFLPLCCGFSTSGFSSRRFGQAPAAAPTSVAICSRAGALETLSDPSTVPDNVPESIKVELKDIRFIAMCENPSVSLAELKGAVHAADDVDSARKIAKATASYPSGRDLIGKAKLRIDFLCTVEAKSLRINTACSIVIEAFKDPAGVEWKKCTELLSDLCAKLSAEDFTKMLELHPLVIRGFFSFRRLSTSM